ncbi:hypothetical protein F0562_001073 [Nyssa sinensis]|uniref:Uncharacterized protein n=1 Tax=Nyssa sinensis TaxID=561372 RepID=A0A5J5C2H2_9ASTE|nr:hypothetical protein F0562_001073 [Nyssa sinensis]
MPGGRSHILNITEEDDGMVPNCQSLNPSPWADKSFTVTMITRVVLRGYAAVLQGVVSATVRGGGSMSSVMAKKGGEESTKTSWVPDPVTGYYRPENKANEIDVAELR